MVGRENGESSELARVSTSDFAVTLPQDEVSESGSGLPVPLLIAIAVVALGTRRLRPLGPATGRRRRLGT